MDIKYFTINGDCVELTKFNIDVYQEEIPINESVEIITTAPTTIGKLCGQMNRYGKYWHYFDVNLDNGNYLVLFNNYTGCRNPYRYQQMAKNQVKEVIKARIIKAAELENLSRAVCLRLLLQKMEKIFFKLEKFCVDFCSKV